MALIYRIYSNGGTGGPVDYVNPVASTPTLTFQAGPLSPSSDTTFAVRAFDPVTGLEEANTDARVRVVIAADGRDVSARPDTPFAVTLSASTGGGARVSWAYRPSETAGVPTGFNIHLGPAGTAPGPTPAATVGYVPGRLGYTCVLPGPLVYAIYAVSVQAFNTSGVDAGGVVISGPVGLPPEPLQMDPVSVRVIRPSVQSH
jgi:hypothetical protein